MSKIFRLLLLVIILGGLLFGIKNWLGDVRPAILPPSSNNNSQRAIFARNLGNARDLEFSPGGTLLVSVPAFGHVLALPDKNSDNQADQNKVILSNLDRPHGLAFYKNKLFVAEEEMVVRYFWDEEKLAAKQDKVLFSLPKGGRHFTRTIAFNKKGEMFVSIGSSCDVCEEKHPWLASVIVSDSEGNNPRLFSRGLRNSVFITLNPQTDKIWATEMGRDFLGDNLPPDEINILEENHDYGWPRCYGNRIPDTKFDASLGKNDCTNTQAPLYEICAHCAPLGLTFTPEGDLLVALHGSWNSSVPVGYKIIKLKVEENKITSQEDFMADFLQGDQVSGRPVDLIFDKAGDLYISDDKSGVIYKVIK